MPPVLAQLARAAIKINVCKFFCGYRPCNRTAAYSLPAARHGTFAAAHKLPAPMHRFFSLLLMLLLVLRGLLGTAMAAGMVPVLLPADGPPQPVVQSVQQQAHSAHQAHAPDALAAAAAAAQTPGPGTAHTPCADPANSPCNGASAHAHSPLCSACEICHSVLLVTPQWGSNLPHPVASEVQPGATARFASAAAALAIKPPIA